MVGSRNNTGKNNPRWKGGISEQWYRKLMAHHRIPAICVDCEITDNLHIHHKNGNHKDNRIGNLEFLCRKCHRKKHPQKSYWKNKKHPEIKEWLEKYQFKKGQHSSSKTEFKKGMIPWWKKAGFKSAKEAIISKRGYFKKEKERL